MNWKQIIEDDDRYFINKVGDVKSYAQFKEGRILKSNYDKDGYKRITLTLNGKNKRYSIHREVLKAFSPHPNQDNLEVNHINGVKDDNRLENLEWVTTSENQQHAFDTGLSKSGGEHTNAQRYEVICEGVVVGRYTNMWVLEDTLDLSRGAIRKRIARNAPIYDVLYVNRVHGKFDTEKYINKDLGIKKGKRTVRIYNMNPIMVMDLKAGEKQVYESIKHLLEADERFSDAIYSNVRKGTTYKNRYEFIRLNKLEYLTNKTMKEFMSEYKQEVQRL